MRRILVYALACAWLCGLPVASSPAWAADDFFDRQIHPILAGKCFRCHGGDRVSGSLRVDSREALVQGGDSGPAFVPGNVEESLLIKAVRRADDVSAMPPDKPLRADEVDALAAWIASGAAWPKQPPRFEAKTHWDFERHLRSRRTGDLVRLHFSSPTN